MRIFIDASVIIAALLSPSGGSSYSVLLLGKHHHIGIISQTILEEVQSKSEKISISRQNIDAFVVQNNFRVCEYISDSEIQPFTACVDASDAHVIAGAKKTKSTYLLTLDKKHLLRLDVQKCVAPLLVVSPKELIEILLS